MDFKSGALFGPKYFAFVANIFILKRCIDKREVAYYRVRKHGFLIQTDLGVSPLAPHVENFK